MSDYRKLLKIKYFSYLWCSQILSQITIQVLNFILLFRLYFDTGSTIATSLLWLSYIAPAILIGPVAPASVDMFNKRSLLIITNFLQSILVFSYAFLYKRSILLLYGSAITYSLLNQFYVPAELASLPTIVKKELLPQANSLFFLSQQMSFIAGFGFAGPISQLLGFRSSLLMCAVLLFIAFICSGMLPSMKSSKKVKKKLKILFVDFFKSMLVGYRYIKKNKTIIYPFLILLGMQVCLVSVAVNTPVILKEFFRASIKSSVVMLVVSGGLGALYATVRLPVLMSFRKRKISLIKSSLITIVLSTMVLVFLVPLFKKPFNLALGVLVTSALGYSFVKIIIPTQTFLQENTPSNFRGRVLGSYGFLLSVATVFPVLLSGTLTEVFGIRTFIFLLGIVFLITLVIIREKGDVLLSKVVG